MNIKISKCFLKKSGIGFLIFFLSFSGAALIDTFRAKETIAQCVQVATIDVNCTNSIIRDASHTGSCPNGYYMQSLDRANCSGPFCAVKCCKF